jgi:hypothetical protein
MMLSNYVEGNNRKPDISTVRTRIHVIHTEKMPRILKLELLAKNTIIKLKVNLNLLNRHMPMNKTTK